MYKDDINIFYTPRIISLCSDLSPNEKNLMALIYSMTRKNKACFLKNDAISKWINVPLPSVKVYLSKLKKRGAIEINTKNGKRFLRISNSFFEQYWHLNDVNLGSIYTP